MSQSTFALVTKTYRGDLAAFGKLCESIDQHMPNVRHVVVLDHGDLDLFAHFAGRNRELVDAGLQLPRLREFSLFGKRVWWLAPNRFVRGWIYQQLAKIAVIADMGEDAVVVVDSDARFVAPVTAAHVFDGGKVRLFRNAGAPSGPIEESPKWHDAASAALGLPLSGYTGADYISTAVVWSPEVVRSMIRQIESVHDQPWYAPLVKPLRFSEYVLYGIYCEHVAGDHTALVRPTASELAHCSWYYDFPSNADVERFVADAAPEKVAILVQSNLDWPAARRDAIFERINQKLKAVAP